MTNNRIRIASLLMAMIIVGMILVPAASAKNNKDDKKENNTGLYGLEMSDYLKEHVNQIDAYTFVSDEDSEEFDAAWDAYLQEAVEQNEANAKEVSALSNIEWDKSKYDFDSISDGEGYSYMHGILEQDFYGYTYYGDGYTRADWDGSSTPERIIQESVITIKGLSVSLSIPASVGFSIVGNTFVYDADYDGQRDVTHTYTGLKAETAYAFTDYDQDDEQQFRFASTSYTLTTHIDL